MGVCLGNVSIKEFEIRTGFILSDEDRKWLESNRTDEATVKVDSGKFHIFDIPFSIHVSELIKDKLVTMLKKYNRISSSKEPCTIAIVRETDKERQLREKKEKERTEQETRDADPNSIWNIKWHMLVPVKANINGSIKDLYYSCFINTYTKGKANIPDIVNGSAYIALDEQGFHGHFKLYNPEKDNDADTFGYDYVIGSGFFSLNGNYIGDIRDATFEEVRFNIRDCIINVQNDNRSIKEIHFYN